MKKWNIHSCMIDKLSMVWVYVNDRVYCDTDSVGPSS
jgi:hypothetical protein